MDPDRSDLAGADSSGSELVIIPKNSMTNANPDSEEEDEEYKKLAHQNIFDEADGTYRPLYICCQLPRHT